MKDYIDIIGAKEHNLKNIDVRIPRHQLTVVSGLSGSGKSSLIFDTLYAEGQRRFIETLSSFAKHFIGGLKRPDVDKITGISPVIAIEQKTVNRNPRSTVGTLTEIYDQLRVLFARFATAYSYQTGKPMVSYTLNEIKSLVFDQFQGQPIYILAPLVVARKGHYRELFTNYSKRGYSEARVDGVLIDFDRQTKLDRYVTHDIELVVDKILPKSLDDARFDKSLSMAMDLGNGSIMIMPRDTEDVHYFSRHLVCPDTGISYPTPEPNTFSFNSPKGSCPDCRGLGLRSVIDMDAVIPNPSMSVSQGAIVPIGSRKSFWAYKQLALIFKKYKGDIDKPFDKQPKKITDAIFNGEHSRFEFFDEKAGITRRFSIEYDGLYKLINDVDSPDFSAQNKKYLKYVPCKSCAGTRLRKESLYFKILDKSISDVTDMSIADFSLWLKEIGEKLDTTSAYDNAIIELCGEINTKVDALLDLGLGYLSLNRRSNTLSGGESQRIRLASQLGMDLVGATYILDEPSIGLHQRDNHKLINSLKRLRDQKNTVIVVEHDKDIMLESDYIIDIGPKAGVHGGELSYQGAYQEGKVGESITLDYILEDKVIPVPTERRTSELCLELKGARGHNLQQLDLKIPMGVLSCITGVSGSGKSSLINQTLYPLVRNLLHKTKDPVLPYKSIKHIEELDKVIKVDQLPIGRTPRSNPATYTDVFTSIRNLFASTVASKVRGFTATTFSYNMKQGRCPVCEGKGKKLIQMKLIPDVYVECEQCSGQRYKEDVLEVQYKGKNIAEVLDMTINTAVEFFDNLPQIRRKIKTLQDVGLGYVTLGQPSTTLSGGEAQRIKLAAELSKKDTKKTLYILDEPTTGLHHEDINILMGVLQKLVDRGNTVVVIEHNMDVIKTADWIIDIGPESGKNGGQIVAEGTPEEVVKQYDTPTTEYLKHELK